MRRILSWPLPLSAVWLLAPLFGAVIAASIDPIPPHDYWWHLAMGRLIATTGSIPSTNLFLYTLPPALPFFDQPWLGQLLMWCAYDLFGHAGNFLLRSVLVFLSFAVVLAATMRRCEDARVIGGCMFLALMLASPVLMVRTQMFAFLPFVLVVWSALGVAEGRLGRRWLLLIPAATALWANLHGSFVMGPAVVGAVAVGLHGERWLGVMGEGQHGGARGIDWAWAGVVVATILAPLLSPHGMDVYRYVWGLTVASSVTTTVTEWLPPRPWKASGALLLLSLCFSVVILSLRRRAVRLHEAILFAGTLYLSVSAMRGLFWWAAVLPVIVAPHAAALLVTRDEEQTTQAAAALHAALLGALLAASLLLQPGVGRGALGGVFDPDSTRMQGEGQYVLAAENPIELARKIGADRRGRVFHDQAVGGLLEVELTSARRPAQVAFVDQRMEWIPDEVWERYFAVSEANDGWAEVLDSFGVDTLLLSPQSQGPLLDAALANDRWEVVAKTSAHMLLYRRGSLDRAEDPPEQ